MLTATAATIATLKAENERLHAELAHLKDENAMLTAQMVVDANRIKRLLGNVPVPPRRVWSSI